MNWDEMINEIINIATELDARNYSNNCLSSHFQNKSWDKLCEEGCELFKTLKIDKEESNMKDKNFDKLIESINNVVKAVDKIKTEQEGKVIRPKVLYAVENINTGNITFNARGGAYQSKEAAYKKVCLMGQNDHRIVEYRLEK